MQIGKEGRKGEREGGKEGRKGRRREGQPASWDLVPERIVWSDTEYLSSRNTHYVKLNSRSQPLTNEKDIELGH